MTEAQRKIQAQPQVQPVAKPPKQHDLLRGRIEQALQAGEETKKTTSTAVQAYQTGTAQLLAYVQNGTPATNLSGDLRKVYDLLVAAAEPLGTEGGLAARVNANVANLHEVQSDYNEACEALEELAERVETYVQK